MMEAGSGRVSFFRIGGDEFSVVLQNDDLQNRDALAEEFRRAMDEASRQATNEWDEVHVSMGIAVFDGSRDQSVGDVLRRADELMYEDKRMGRRTAWG